MLINLHAHSTLGAFFDDPHPEWGPFREKDERGYSYLRIGKWELHLSTVEAEKAIREGRVEELVREAKERADNPDWRIRKMDEAGQDVQVISVPSHMAMYHTEPEFGIRFTRKANDANAGYCRAYPERLYFWAHIPMQDPAAAAAELERAVTELGAKGAAIGGANYGGREADDEALYPVWQKACELDVPIWVHGYNQSVTWGEAAKDERYEITSIVGMCYDESRFFWNIVCGGVLDRFPDLKLIVTHGGGYVPYQLGRFEATNEVLMDARNAKPVSAYLENFWFDPLIHALPMRRAIVEVIGSDHLVYGDNFGGSDTIRENLVAGLDLAPEDSEKITSGNAARLLGIEVSATAATSS
jgi:predicted TIM-barrel fold metal-dependent hydrolase